MDLQRLLKTYLHVNDPKRRNVTIKLAVFIIAAAAFGLVAYQVAGPGFGGQSTAPAADTTEASDTTDGQAQTECMDPAQVDAWLEEHPEYDVISREVTVEGEVCIKYVEPYGI